MCQMFSTCFQSICLIIVIIPNRILSHMITAHANVTSSSHHTWSTWSLSSLNPHSHVWTQCQYNKQAILKFTEPDLNVPQDHLSFLTPQHTVDKHTSHQPTWPPQRTAARMIPAPWYRHETVQALTSPVLFCNCFGMWGEAGGWGGVKRALWLKRKNIDMISYQLFAYCEC